MISVKDMISVEKKAAEIGVTECILMENAGANALRVLEKEINVKGKKIIIFCGTGNNAGDGFVFARHALMRGAHVTICLAKKSEVLRTEVTRRNYSIIHELKSMGSKIDFYAGKIPKGNFDIAVDALLGTGLKNKVSDEYTKFIEHFNKMKAFKVSLDSPSGIDCDTGNVMGIAIKPDMTITFYERKKGLNKKNSGKIVTVDIGIPKI